MAHSHVLQLLKAFFFSFLLTAAVVAIVLGILMGLRDLSPKKAEQTTNSSSTYAPLLSPSSSSSTSSTASTSKTATTASKLTTSSAAAASTTTKAATATKPTTSSSSSSTTTSRGTAGGASPHIVVIIADDLGWNDVGFRYPGSNQMYTPNIDRLHREGLNLMNSYMYPVCTPSRAALMTGKYAFRYGMQSEVLSALDNASLPLDLKTMPEHLQELEYTTRLVGKWHLGFCNPKMTPTGRGFDSFFGMYNGMSTYSTYIGKWDGFDLHDDANGTFRVASEWSGNYSTQVYTSKAVEILENHNKSKPLFLVLSYQAVHGPLEAPQSYMDAYCANITGNGTEDRRTRCGVAAAMDEGVGNVTAALERLGYADNLVTLFVSDNGGPISEGSSNWPLRGGKITMWEGGTRVVTIVHSKSHLPQVFQDKNAKQWDGLMHAVDWYPTLLRLAGSTSNITGIDGVDNWRPIADQTASSREWFVYNVNDDKNTSAIRYRNYKLLHNGGGNPDGWFMPPLGSTSQDAPAGKKPEFQLYDLRTDEREMNNIANKTEVQGIFNVMKEALLKAESEAQTSVTYSSLEQGKPKYHDMDWVTGWC